MNNITGRPGGRGLAIIAGRVSNYTIIVLSGGKEVIAVGDAIFFSAMHSHREQVLTMIYDSSDGVAFHFFLTD